jgi:A/G-specific adenine glycosylase
MFFINIRWHFSSVGRHHPLPLDHGCNWPYWRFRGFIQTIAAMNSKLKLVPALLGWFAQNARDLPWRRTRDPYAIWVSEIMLQQTQVKTVIPYWKRWMRELPTIEAVAKARSEKIHKLWEGLGYYTRARNLQKAAKQIVAQPNACSVARRRRGNESQIKGKSETPHVVSYKFPENFDDVLALPGIGRYTAGAICSIAFNQPTPILDGNVIRVLTRIFGIGENPREKKTNARLWRLAEDLVGHAASSPSICRRRRKESHSIPHSSQRLLTSSPTCTNLNQSLMELGALVCTPRNPQCMKCPVKKLCAAFREGRIWELPNLGKREAAIARRFVAFVVERNGRFLVRQRPAGVVNAHLWEFPNVEIGARLSEPQHPQLQNTAGKISTTDGTRTFCGSEDPRSKAAANAAMHVLGFMPSELTPLCTVKHSITHYRITLEVFHVHLGGASYTSRHNKNKMGRRGPSSAVALLRRVETPPSGNNGVWLPLTKLDLLAFTAAHKKILTHLKHDGRRLR